MEEQPTTTIEREIRGCELHPGPPSFECEACVTMHGLKMTTPNLKAMMTVGAIRNRFRAGEPSRNPAGRPKNRTFDEMVRALLEEDVPDGKGGTMERGELIARALLANAATGKGQAVKLVIERLWPKLVKHEVDAKGSVVVMFDDQDRREIEASEGGGDGRRDEET